MTTDSTHTETTLYRVWWGESPDAWEGWDLDATFAAARDEVAAAVDDEHREEAIEALSIEEVPVFRRGGGAYKEVSKYDPDYPDEGWTHPDLS